MMKYGPAYLVFFSPLIKQIFHHDLHLCVSNDSFNLIFKACYGIIDKRGGTDNSVSTVCYIFSDCVDSISGTTTLMIF